MSQLLNLPGLAASVSDDDRVPIVNMASGQEGTVTVEELMGGYVLFELTDPVSITATDLVRPGASEYCGFHVRAAVGFPQTVTVYDALSATGTPIHTVSVTALGYYPWSGNKVRPCTTGVYATITGGTSRTAEFL